MSALEGIYRRSSPWLQNLFLNLHALQITFHRYDRPYHRAVTDLLAQERWPRSKIDQWQLKQLQRMVHHAYTSSPYYRRTMDKVGVKPDDITGLDVLHRLPLLTKDEVRSHGPELLTADRPQRGWLHGHTSGTTGSPLGLWYDRDMCRINNAVDRQLKIWAGMSDDDWLGILLGRVVVPIHSSGPPFWRVNHVQRQIWFSSFHMAGPYLDYYVAEMERRKLRFLEGYPSTLYVLATHLLRRGQVLPMRSVITSSETLHTLQRDAIESAFQCKVYDFYALAERVIFAGECGEGGGKHLAETYGITEVVDEEGHPVPEGETGYLVGSSLHNTAMPMLRYRTGDVSAFLTEPCPCGRTLRRIRGVSTKAEDIVITPDGRQISPSILTHPFKPLDQIVASQIVQEETDRLLIRIVPSDQFSKGQEEALIGSLKERLGEEMKIQVEYVPEIPREKSGKFRWVISRVPHACSLDWEEH